LVLAGLVLRDQTQVRLAAIPFSLVLLQPAVVAAQKQMVLLARAVLVAAVDGVIHPLRLAVLEHQVKVLRVERAEQVRPVHLAAAVVHPLLVQQEKLLQRALVERESLRPLLDRLLTMQVVVVAADTMLLALLAAQVAVERAVKSMTPASLFPLLPQERQTRAAVAAVAARIHKTVQQVVQALSFCPFQQLTTAGQRLARPP
jgi:hypothetical protein